MKRSAAVFLVLFGLLCGSISQAANPVISNVVARQRSDGSGIVDITYNLTDSDSSRVYVSVEISTDGGTTYSARTHVTGHAGFVATGGSRAIQWDAKTILGSAAIFPNCKARITASDTGGGEMIYIPAGYFLMGNNGSEPHSYSDEFPQHSVYLSGYYIGRYEVTRGEYRKFMEAGGYSNPAYWSGTGWSWKVSKSRTQPGYWAAVQDSAGGSAFTQTDSHPVVGVTYYEAEAYCNWAGGHLPTEAQWEKAARWTGSYPNVYPWGNTWDAEKCNNYYDHNPAGGGYNKYQTAPVGSYPLGISPYGCHDMAGNVMEWCRDWYSSSYYSASPTTDPQGPASGTCRVLRGGGWGYGDDLNRCATRNDSNPNYYFYNLGFRIAR